MKSRQSESKPRRSSRSASSVDEHPVAVNARKRGTVLNDLYRVDEEKTIELILKTGSCGQGSILVVRRNKHAASDFFALKMPINEDQKAGVTREIELWANLAPHANIATLHDVGCEFDLPALLTPLAAHGNLENYIQQRQSLSLPPGEDCEYNVLGLQEPLCFALQIASGLEFLHHQNVIHSDLKPKNVLVYDESFNRDFPVHLKICDLGYSVKGQREDGVLCGHRLGGGTKGYAPPELRDRKQVQNTVTEHCDTWGLVMCLLCATNGCLPEEMCEVAPHDRQQAFQEACSSGVFAHALSSDCEVSIRLQALVAEGLQPEPRLRPVISACSERLLELFTSAGGDIESRCAPPDKTLALIPSLSKEREYLVALHVHKDEEVAEALRQEWQELLGQEKTERESGLFRSLPGDGELSQDCPMLGPQPTDAGQPLAPPKYYVGCKRSAKPSAPSQSKSRR